MTHLKKQEWYVADVPLALAQEMVARLHYSRGGSNTRVYAHGLYRKADNKLMGIAWWLPPTRVACESVSIDWKKVLSLTRLVCEPECPTNAASFLIGNSVKMIWKDDRFHTLVTYADESQGHTGNIYRATNWQYVGRTGPYPRWLDATGKQVAAKATVNRTKAEMLALGHKKQGSFYKHKFVLHNPTRKSANIGDSMPLSPTATKKEQIALINHLESTLDLLVSFAFGDENALDKLTTMMAQATSEAPKGATTPVTFAIESAPPTSNLVPFHVAAQPFSGQPTIIPPTNFKCKCPMAVKDKDSVTHLCLVCGLNAYENHYVFSHTDEGKAMIAGQKEVVVDDWHEPAGVVDAAVFIAAPVEFQPTTEEDHYPDAEEIE